MAVSLLELGDKQGQRSRGQAMLSVSRPGPQWQPRDVRTTSLREVHPGVHAYDYSEPPLQPNVNRLKGLDEAGPSVAMGSEGALEAVQLPMWRPESHFREALPTPIWHSVRAVFPESSKVSVRHFQSCARL